MSTKVDLTGGRRTLYGTWLGEREPQLVLLSVVQEPREFHLLQNPQRMTARLGRSSNCSKIPSWRL